MICPTAKIDPEARIGANVAIGSYSIVHANVEIGDNSVIESHCIIGYPTPLAPDFPLRIGSGSLIRSHTIVYAGTTIGAYLMTGHHVVIRERTTLGQNCQVGSYTELQGDLEFGDYSRTQSSVFIPKHCRIGSAVWLMPRVCLTNDPHPPSDPGNLGVCVEDFAVIAAASTVLPGVTIGTRSLVAAGSLVTRDVAPDRVVAGAPARERGWAHDIPLRDGSGNRAYPWMKHFHRGYPPELVQAWLDVFGRIPDGD